MWRKTVILALLTLAGLKAPCSDRYVTLTARWSETNSLEIAEGEVVELVSFPAAFNRGREISVFRGKRLLSNVSSHYPSDGGSSSWPKTALLVAGPARLALNGVGNASVPPTFCTFRVFSESYPPTGAVVIPPGPGGGVIGLQCSSDLINWGAATNGMYTNEPTAKFFRLTLDRIFPKEGATALQNAVVQGLQTDVGMAEPVFNGGKRFLTWAPEPDGAKLDISAGRVVNISSVFDPGYRFFIEKNGETFTSENLTSHSSVKTDPIIVAGPVRFRAQGSPALTFEVFPNAVDPQTTLIVPPGAAGGRVQIQQSTNLLDWASAEPGTYTNLTAASFFRISLERIPR